VGGKPIDGLIMLEANQEHGVIAHRSGDPDKTPMLPVGTMLRILPNHACATGAQHDRYHVIAGAEHGLAQQVKAVWPRFSGW
jgi:D-serine deaminase-like pyridoxal phosphate-dependent protein